MDFSLSKEQQELADRCRKFAQNEIGPHVKEFEEDIPKRLALYQKIAKEGFFLMALSMDTGAVGYLTALKELSKVDAGLVVAIAVTNMAAEAIVKFGNEAQQKKYLPMIASGSCVPLSFALTEKLSGSDAKSIQTSLTEADGAFILNGEKQFISNADIAGAIIVMAKGPKGISAIIVDRGTPGMTFPKKENKLGLLTANLVSIRFENCRIPKENLLGNHGDGLKIALESLDSGRIGIAAQAIGIGEAAYEAALSFSKQRQQFGKPIGENQSIAFRLADMRVKLDAGMLLAYKAAWTKDNGRPFTLGAAEAKLYCSEICNEIAGDALQIHGGYGYIKDYPAEKYFRDARVTTLYEGTSEIQRMVISRNLNGPEWT